MGENYYVRTKPCVCCGMVKRTWHLGKSSCGWTFSFRGYRNAEESPSGAPIISYEAWALFLDNNTEFGGKYQIVNEQDEVITTKMFYDLVDSKRNSEYNHTKYIKYQDDTYYTTSKKYLDNNWLDNQDNSFTDWEFC